MRTCEIKLTRGLVTLVDEDDYEKFGGFKWYANKNSGKLNGEGETYFRAARRAPREDGGRALLLLHREITAAPRGMVVDHINHDPLDNRKQNLRICSHSENCGNRIIRRGSSKYKGVSWQTPSRKWRAEISCRGKRQYLGLFEHEEHAALEYNRAAVQLFGPFAFLNEVVDACEADTLSIS